MNGTENLSGVKIASIVIQKIKIVIPVTLFNGNYQDRIIGFVQTENARKVGEVRMIQIDKPMPDGCDVCPLMYDYIQCNALPEGCKDYDDFNNDEFDWTKRPGWCPLKEIVRCKDCKHSTVSGNGLIKCGHTFRSADFFCADGERRTDND